MVIGPTQSAIPRRRFDSKAGQTLITDVTINRARAFPIRRLHKKKSHPKGGHLFGGGGDNHIVL